MLEGTVTGNFVILICLDMVDCFVLVLAVVVIEFCFFFPRCSLHNSTTERSHLKYECFLHWYHRVMFVNQSECNIHAAT